MRSDSGDVLTFGSFENLWRSGPGGARDMVIVIVAALIVGGIVAVWAVFFRKRARRPSSLVEHGRKRRHARSRQLPRNPTLAQTGGLPPVRTTVHSDD